MTRKIVVPAVLLTAALAAGGLLYVTISGPVEGLRRPCRRPQSRLLPVRG